MSYLAPSWTSLHPLGGTMQGQRVAGLPSSAALYIAVDAAGTRHLLVRVGDSARLDLPKRTKALDVRLDMLSISGLPQERYVVLTCRDSLFHSLFDSLIANIAEAIGNSPPNTGEETLRIVERWRKFWSVEPGALSEEAALGLFGELWFLTRWVGTLDGAGIEGWRGPLGANHDFQWAAFSVEVKTTAVRGASVRHRIVSLEQLDTPARGKLFLFSLHVLEDALGANTLATLVRSARGMMDGNLTLLDVLDERLVAAGYSPAADTVHSRSYRIVSEELYRVEPGFPRLTRSSFLDGLPAGIGAVGYELSMSACAPFRVATSPAQAGPLLLPISPNPSGP